MELKRARAGVAVLTLQFEVQENSAFMEALLSADEDILEVLAEYDAHTPVVAFLDRPARGPVVTNMLDDDRPETAGPATWKFAAVRPAQQPAVAIQAAQRDARFNEKPWWEQAVENNARDGRFAPAEVR